MNRCPVCNTEMGTGGCPNQYQHNLGKQETKPFTCPVCLGNGLVAIGFYNQVGGAWVTSGIQPETCRSCKGSGVVWRP